MGIELSTEPQTIEEYNEDLEIGNSEIDNGDFITCEDLKIEVRKW